MLSTEPSPDKCQPASLSLSYGWHRAGCAKLDTASDVHSRASEAGDTQLTACAWCHTTSKTEASVTGTPPKKWSNRGLGWICFLKEVIAELGLQRQIGFEAAEIRDGDSWRLMESGHTYVVARSRNHFRGKSQGLCPSGYSSCLWSWRPEKMEREG